MALTSLSPVFSYYSFLPSDYHYVGPGSETGIKGKDKVLHNQSVHILTTVPYGRKHIAKADSPMGFLSSLETHC